MGSTIVSVTGHLKSKKMVRKNIKWRFLFVLTLLLFNVFTKSSPIEKSPSALVVSDISLPKLKMAKLDGSEVIRDSGIKTFKFEVAENERPSSETVLTEDARKDSINGTRNLIRNVRPGQTVLRYTVKISFDGDTFNGEAVIYVRLDSTDDPIIFHLEALDVHDVRTGIISEDNVQSVGCNLEDGVIEIFPNNAGGIHIVVIEYSGEINNFGKGIFQGGFNDYRYVGMNLFPTNARRVFPCMDELQAVATISFIFEEVPFDEIVSNSMREDNNPNQFQALQVPPHLWGMVAHNFFNIDMPAPNVILYGRPDLNQNSLASIAIEAFFTSYNEKLNKMYFTINANQDGRLHIFALPDTNMEWNALSTICIWEPHIFMTNTHSMMQRKTALVKIANAMARQWFGYVVYPEDWKDQWVISGLASHAAQEVVTDFQSSDNEDVTLLDMNTIFTTDVIQEALLQDSYSSAVVISPEEDMFDEVDIRHHTLGLLKLKAPAIMRMLRLVLSDEDDFVLRAGQLLLNRRTLSSTSLNDFIDAVNYVWPGNDNIDDVGAFLEPWIQNTGYPVLHVGWKSNNSVLLTQEHFSFADSEVVGYRIPVTFTTNQQKNYNNMYPTVMLENPDEISLLNILDEDDYVIFNIQGQGYYRVNYDMEHWDRIISALDDPDRRQEIHPLNRASLIDDALNLARAGKVEYDVALRLALTWAHETEYGPWKAFVRNMEFLKKMLLSAVTDNGELDSNIYKRMVRRTIGTFEDDVSFHPNPSIREPAMTSLTRGIVMDHACRSNYDPCIAAAIDWFYNTNSDEPAVNPNIPVDIQPAVFCTMVREAGAEATNLLYAYLETGISHYDRLVVLESLACSHDEVFINKLMMDTISEDGPFGSEERSIILAAIIRSRFENVFHVIDFMRSNTNNIRVMYGGPQKLEELLFVLSDNIVNDRLESNFRVWVRSNINDLDDSEVIAIRALSNAEINLEWRQRSVDEVYTWIDNNDAHTFSVSFTLLFFTAFICRFNLSCS